MRDWKEETRLRVEFIRQQLKQAGAKGIVYGNSGGKDSALVGICLLYTSQCKRAVRYSKSHPAPAVRSPSYAGKGRSGGYSIGGIIHSSAERPWAGQLGTHGRQDEKL